MKILSWNVNGIRAIQKKGFLEWLEREKPDILGVQETKAHPDQLDAFLMHPAGYETYWAWSTVKKGYSGVAIFTKEKPLSVKRGFGIKKFDEEGRVLIAEYPGFVFLNIYFPNGKMSDERLQYKMDFYAETLKYTKMLKAQGKRLLFLAITTQRTKRSILRGPKKMKTPRDFYPSSARGLINGSRTARWIFSGSSIKNPGIIVGGI